ncbi:FCD domain-containing protein [Mesorhizobium sp. YR577]|uniref:FadR/GntR family transcriptional regulator n=1 Tax=Mesorhizobium sp. YR577 TaxID=1884373 RepID=UPI0008E681D3|nr:FCD domain-containing protein [Mesorhizobium sp. YR577]SFU22368.1 transcriptional regulator, GntR family [Mesorhizobium sp. YR577]
MQVQFEPLQTEPAFRLVARAIEAKILSREIQPGDTLPSEAKLAESLGVNRSTIREAIRALEQNGFVRRETGRKKLFATFPQSVDISRRLKAAMVLDQVTFEELWEAMFALEPAAARLASQRRTDEDLEALEANLAHTRLALADSQALTELDIDFHRLVALATGNRAIQAARLPISELFYPPFLTVMSRLNAAERLLLAHEKIVESIRNRDDRLAQEWMEKHIQDFRRGYELANLDMGAPAALPQPRT